jgi:hypothetical protein
LPAKIRGASEERREHRELHGQRRAWRGAHAEGLGRRRLAVWQLVVSQAPPPPAPPVWAAHYALAKHWIAFDHYLRVEAFAGGSGNFTRPGPERLLAAYEAVLAKHGMEPGLHRYVDDEYSADKARKRVAVTFDDYGYVVASSAELHREE